MAEQTHPFPPQARIRPTVAKRRIEAFKKHFGEAHLYFAWHAAFPLAITPELLYHLWANFRQDTQGKQLNIPWIAVADLLLSGLCDEVSHELFEMDITIRKILLSDLEASENFGQKRLLELSHFLSRYIQLQIKSHDPHIREVAQTNQWIALAYTHDGNATVVRDLAQALGASLKQNNAAEQTRLASLTDMFAEPLKDFQPLLMYARGIGYFAQGDLVQARAHFKMIGKEEQAAGEKLIIPIDIDDKEEIPQQEQVTTDIVMPEADVIPSSSYPPIWHIPYQRNPFFTGREDVLSQLHSALHEESTVALSHPRGISGLGGIGKTQIALEYAYKYHSEYSAVFWIRADSVTSLTSSLIELGHLLKLPERQEQDQQIIVEAVLRWLRLHPGWLLIYDNIDDFSIAEPFLPRAGQGHILFTTRVHAFGAIAQRLDLSTMEANTGALLLLRRASILPLQATLDLASENDRHLANQISQELDGLPLALDQAGAYIKETSCTLADYLSLYQKHRYDLLQTRKTLSHDYPASVATTWSLSFEKVAQANPASADLLYLCAFLAPTAIPVEIFTLGSSFLGNLLTPVASDPPQLDLACNNAAQYSLIIRTMDNEIIMHRLVQVILQHMLLPEVQITWKTRAISVVNAAFPDAIFENWTRCERLSPHALVCANWIEHEHILKPEVIHLLNEAGSYLYARAHYKDAMLLLEQALQISQQLGADRPDTAITLNNLANLYRVQGKYAEAEPLYKRARHIREGQLGTEHPNTAQNLNDLAQLYALQEKYPEAESLLIRALQIRERQLGSEHPDTAQSLHNLAQLYVLQGKHLDAEPLLIRALQIRERHLGTEHPDIAQSLNDLGQLYVLQGKHLDAEPLLIRALQIRERHLGTEHPDTTQSLHNLAQLYALRGKHFDAESLIHEQHVETEDEYHDATQTVTQEKHEETRPLHTTLADEQQLEVDHPDSEDTQKDFFISYAHQDWDWAKWIDEQLVGAGYTTILPARDFPAGGHVILEMSKAAHAKRTIAVLSPDYLTSKFTEPEWSAALYQDPTGERGLLLPVRVLPAEVSGMLAPLIYIDLVGQEDKEKARKILLEGVEQTPKKLKPKPAAISSQTISEQSPVTDMSRQSHFGEPFPEYWNIPRRHVAYFTGRDAQIEQIFQAFNNRDAALASDPQAIVGLGGLGKTQTATEYAYRYRAHYRAVLWVRADTKENLMADFRSLVRLLRLPEQEDPIETMHTWFTTQRDWLLIFDGADDLQIVRDFLPPGTHRRHVLLTTRVRAAGNIAQPLLLEPLNPEDGALCILRRANYLPWNGQLSDARPASVEAAQELSQLMDGLPLALEQAGAYIETTGRSVSGYLDLYRHYRSEIQRRQYGLLPNYPTSVAFAWTIAKELVRQKEPVAFALLQCCAFLAPDAIPEEIFTQGASVLGKELESVVTDTIALDSVTSTLRKYSFLKREVNKEDAIDSFSIHRIIQEILRDEMDETTQQMWAERAVRAVFLALPFVEEHIMQAQVRHCIPLIKKWNMTFPEAKRLQQYVEERRQ